jgi:hypothetical protein
MDAALKKIKSATWIGKYFIGRFHDKFEVLCGLEQMTEDDGMT